MYQNLSLNLPVFSKSRLKEEKLIIQSVANRSQPLAPSERKDAVIAFLKEHKQAKTTDFIDIIGLSDGRTRALLREMVSDGIIEKVGDKRYTHYVLKS